MSTAKPTLDDYAQIFDRLCHIAALSHGGKLASSIDNVVVTTLAVHSDSDPMSVPQLSEAVDAYFNVNISRGLIRESLDRQARSDQEVIRRTRDSPPRYRLTPEAKSRIDDAINAAQDLESAVKKEWIEGFFREGHYVPVDHHDHLWRCLLSYVQLALHRHGAEALRLLQPSGTPPSEADHPLREYLAVAVSQHCNDEVCLSLAPSAVAHFFQIGGNLQEKYLGQLLDATFTFFALTSDNATSFYLRNQVKPLQLFLDTNVVFSLFNMHDTPLDDVAIDVVQFIREHEFPFTLFVFEDTVREFRGAVGAARSKLTRRNWSSAASAVTLQYRKLSGLEKKYHDLNAEQQVRPEVFLSRFTRPEALLSAHGIGIFQSSLESASVEGGKERQQHLTERYTKFLDDISFRDDRNEGAIEHDIDALLRLVPLRSLEVSALDSGALFLTVDTLFHGFVRQLASTEPESGSVVLPNHLLLVLRPFVSSTDDFDSRFVQTIGGPQLRVVETGYSAVQNDVFGYRQSFQGTSDRRAASDVLRDTIVEVLSRTIDGKADPNAISVSDTVEMWGGSLLDHVDSLEEERRLMDAKGRANEARFKELDEERLATKAEIHELQKKIQSYVENERSLSTRVETSEDKLRKLEDERRRVVSSIRIVAVPIAALALAAGVIAQRRFGEVGTYSMVLFGWLLVLVVYRSRKWSWLAQQNHPLFLGIVAAVLWWALCMIIKDPTKLEYWITTVLGLVVALAAPIVDLRSGTRKSPSSE